MIWARRLRMAREESTWALPFADLMTLLLVVFVLIVSMSDLKRSRFDAMGRSVRRALGYAALESKPAPVAAAAAAGPTLRDRLEAELLTPSEVQLRGPDDEKLPTCEIRSEADAFILRVPADEAFMGPTAILAPRTRKLLACIADQLRDGHARMQVRGYGPEGTVPPGLPYRDRMDIACERARAARLELIRAGVMGDRLASAASEDPFGGRGFELTIYASPAGAASGMARESAD